MDRSGDGENRVTHLFDGDFSDPGRPMCRWAYDKFGGYSIWRNNLSIRGICKICERRAKKGLKGVDPNE